MTDQIYHDILTIANTCIDYCNEILALFNHKAVVQTLCFCSITNT